MAIVLGIASRNSAFSARARGLSSDAVVWPGFPGEAGRASHVLRRAWLRTARLALRRRGTLRKPRHPAFHTSAGNAACERAASVNERTWDRPVPRAIASLVGRRPLPSCRYLKCRRHPFGPRGSEGPAGIPSGSPFGIRSLKSLLLLSNNVGARGQRLLPLPPPVPFARAKRALGDPRLDWFRRQRVAGPTDTGPTSFFIFFREIRNQRAEPRAQTVRMRQACDRRVPARRVQTDHAGRQRLLTHAAECRECIS
jgi:hypothetical protein